jgi:hypothetical protein
VLAFALAVALSLAGIQPDDGGGGFLRDLLKLLFAEVLRIYFQVAAAYADYAETRFFFALFYLAPLAPKNFNRPVRPTAV